ncbi:MAG TPA: hypothetical protein VGE12_17230 [Noviherbaspirillum sp.]
MISTRQKGELSLMWAAVLIGVVTLVAMVGLMSARHERNYFGEAWKRLTRTEAGQVLQQTQQSAERAVKQESADVKKCMIDGKVVYSNVECDTANPTSRKVQLHDTKGFEAPKQPPAPAPEAEGKDMRQKMIDKAVER